MERFFPEPNGDGRSRWRETHVLWDLDGCETIPKNPFEMKEKIEYLIRKQGYSGEVSFWLVAYEKTIPPDLVDLYGDAGFLLLTEGDKDAIVSTMLLDILFWALRSSREPGNLLVISGNINFGQDKFAAIRQSMENKGFCVAIAPLEPFIKVEVPRMIMKGSILLRPT